MDFRLKSVAFNSINSTNRFSILFIGDVKNSGSSPAISTQVLFNVFQEPDAQPLDYDLGQDESRTDIAASSVSERTLRKPINLNLDRLVASEDRLKIVVEVHFSDVFENSRILDFEGYVEGNWKSLKRAVDSGGNKAISPFSVKTTKNQERKC